MPKETNHSFHAVDPAPRTDPIPLTDPAPLSSAIGEFWSLPQTAARLGVPESRLLDLVQNNSVLHVLTADEQLLFPAFQFRSQKVIPSLVPILQTVLAATNGWEVTQWLMTPAERLDDKTPLEVARVGDADAVQRLQSLATKQAALWRQSSSQ